MSEERNFDFMSEIKLNEEDFCNIHNISFRVFQKPLWICVAASFVLTIIQLILYFQFNSTLGLFDYTIAFIALFATLKYYELTQSPAKCFSKNRFLTGKGIIEEKAIFTDKIQITSNTSQPIEVFYSSIKEIFKEKDYYVFLLENNCLLAVEQNPKICNLEDETLKEYLLSECSNLKTPKIKTLISQKKLCISLIALLFIFLAISLFAPSVITFIKEYLADKLIYMNALN